MKKTTNRNQAGINSKVRWRRKILSGSVSLAILVAAVTTIRLIMPAVALTKQVQRLDCAHEVHTHDASCYAKVTDEDGNVSEQLICGKADYVIHVHNDDCYEEETYFEIVDGEEVEVTDRVLTCPLPETEPHVHDASCYETLTDADGNQYEELTCDRLELHTHTKDCYEKGHNGDPAYLTCGQLELAEHVHGGDCLYTETVEIEEPAEEADENVSDPEPVDGTEEPSVEEGAEYGVEEGIEEGMEAGFEEGEEAGFEEGTDEGLEEDAEAGLEEGSADGTEEGVEEGTEEDAEEGTEGDKDGESDLEAGDSEEISEEETDTRDVDEEAELSENGSDAEAEPDKDVDNGADTDENTDADLSAEKEYNSESNIEIDAAAFPAQSFEKETENIRVSIEAPVGALPAGTELIVTDVFDEETIYTIKDAVDDKEGEKIVHAADITFKNADGEEIEPLLPITVVMEALEPATADDPVIVHVDDDGNAEQVEEITIAAGENSEIAGADGAEDSVGMAGDADANGNTDSAGTDDVADSDAVEEQEEVREEETQEENVEAGAESADSEDAEIDRTEGEETQSVVSSQAEDVLTEENPAEEVSETSDDISADIADENHQDAESSAVTFVTADFSVYALVYTVDFHWEVNGKMYEFSIPGGGFVSFTDLVEVLGIVDNTNSDENNAKIDAATHAVDGSLDVTVSDAAKKFVADVDSVEFSSPELVDVSRVKADTTVGQIKESRGLECEYSAELTEEQIVAINAQSVEVGDWALISVQPFLSEELLTVTMTNGEVFTIRTTDAQIKKTVITSRGETYEIIVTYGPEAEIPDGAELRVSEITEDMPGYAALCEAMEEKLGAQGQEHSTIPTLFDISIIADGKEIEPAPHSEVKVEAKLVRNSLSPIFDRDKTPVLINDEPLTMEDCLVDAHIRVIHAKNDGETELVNVDEDLTQEEVTSAFTTDSFSDWLMFLDEELSSITIGVDDSLTLRPYSSWIWKRDGELPAYSGGEWDFSDTSVWQRGSEIRGQKHNSNGTTTNNAVIGYEYTLKNYPGGTVTFRVYEKWDSELEEAYNVAYGWATAPGTFNVKTTKGKTVQVNVVGDVRDVPPVITDTANISVNLFNYDNTSTHVLDNRNNTGTNPYNNNVNQNHYLKFVGWGYDGGNGLGKYTKTTSNPGIVYPTLGTVNGKKYPKLNSSNYYQSLDYLFDTTARGEAVNGYANVNGLFQLDQNGYYYYNSNKNYAWFDEENNRFVLYEHTFSQNTEGTLASTGSSVNAKPIGFFPFHRYDAPVADNNHSGMNFNSLLDHHFGMSMEVEFALPQDKLAPNEEHIIYEFSGDDDLWVFVDDDLVLDIGGIHQPVRGYIDFTTGDVYVYGKGTTTSQKVLSLGTSKHTLRMFYLERGGCDSNLSVRFNLPLSVGDVTFTKTDVGQDPSGLPGALFGLYRDQDCTQLVSTAGSSNEEGHVGEVAFIDVPVGTYYMKELRAPNGYILDDTKIYKVTIADENDPTQQSSIVRMSDNQTVTSITNQPDLTQLNVQKSWVGDMRQIPSDASVTVTLGRYRLVPEEVAQGGTDPATLGTLIIKQVLADNGAKDHAASFKVDYKVKNATGEVVREGSYTGTSGVTLTGLEPGTYSIEALCSSTDGAYYVGNPKQERTDIVIEDYGSAEITFSNTLTKSTESIRTHRVQVISGNDTDNNGGSWPVGYYDENTQLQLTWQWVSDRIKWNHDDPATQYNGWTHTYMGEFWYQINGGTRQRIYFNNDGTWTLPITVDKDYTITLSYSGGNNVGDWNSHFDWLSNPTLTVVGTRAMSAKRMLASGRTMMLGAGGPITITNTAANPEAREGYVVDTTSSDVSGWSMDVTLPNGSSWERVVNDLPKVALDGSIYVYYIASVTETGMPAGTTGAIGVNGEVKQVVYGDATQTGTLNLTNTLPEGYLRIDKAVTYNGNVPTTNEQKSALAGTYTFVVCTDEGGTTPYKTAQDEDLKLTVTILENGMSKSSEPVKLPVGNYWIREENPTQEGVTPDENEIPVSVRMDCTTEAPAIASFTNNKAENKNPDELAIDLEKTFTGLPMDKIPTNFHPVLSYYPAANATKRTTLTLGDTQGNVTRTISDDHTTWHWHVTHIPTGAHDFQLSEENFAVAGYNRTTVFNGDTEHPIADPSQPQNVTVLVPEVTLEEVTSTADYTTPDNHKAFTLEENQILLVRMTSNATVIVSQKSLSIATRTAIENYLDENGWKIVGDDSPNAQWKKPAVYFSKEVHGSSFAYGGRTIYFDENNVVRIPHKSSSHEVRADVVFSEDSDGKNCFTLENSYEEVPISLEIIKTEKDSSPVKYLPGADFTITRLNEEDSSIEMLPGTTTHAFEQTQTTGDEDENKGKLTFNGLTTGIYEIKETKTPSGYVIDSDMTIYIRVENGVVTWLEKTKDGSTITWTEKETSANGIIFNNAVADDPETAANEAVNASFTIPNTPGAELPHTGGPGTRLFTILGSILILGAGILLWRRRRLI